MRYLLVWGSLMVSLSTFSFGNESYLRSGMAFLSLKNFDETALTFAIVKGEKLPTIDSNFALEFEFVQSVDFSFDVLSIGAYGTYEFSLAQTPFSLSPRLGISYDALDIQEITLNEESQNIKEVSLNYGLLLRYKFDEEMGFFLDITQKKNSRMIAYGTEVKF